MKQTRRRSLSPGANKFLLVLNIVLFLGAIVLAVLNIDLKEYIPAVAMLFVHAHKRHQYLWVLETPERATLISLNF